MIKPIDMSVLPDGFLIETPVRTISGGRAWKLDKMNSLFRTYRYAEAYRPALNHWHFNDGAMVLPDGLVVEVMFADGDQSKACDVGDYIDPLSWIFNFEDDRLEPESAIAVTILGVTVEYGAQLGMEVVDV